MRDDGKKWFGAKLVQMHSPLSRSMSDPAPFIRLTLHIACISAYALHTAWHTCTIRLHAYDYDYDSANLTSVYIGVNDSRYVGLVALLWLLIEAQLMENVHCCFHKCKIPTPLRWRGP